jgi:glycosyltransferase involved in cell wall biosynthesis
MNGPHAHDAALAHHWAVGMRGGEKVLEALGGMFPEAPIYTLVAKPENLSESLRRHRFITSPLQRLPGGARHYKKLLPLFPWAIRRLRVADGTRVVISSDASMIKGLTVPEGAVHICYCHSPPRYLWDMSDIYLKNTAGLGAIGGAVFRSVIPRARSFDRAAAGRVTHFIANSAFVQKRIRDFYGRDAEVIHPPVDVDAFDAGRARADFYLLVSELVPYKRVDLAVEAFRKTGRRLVVIGDGSEMAALRASAPANVEFLGRQPFPVLREHFETCRAFLYPQIEDFGITAVEAQAAGSPVIAYRAGGALETVIEGETGIFFGEQSAASLAEAVMACEGGTFDSGRCRANAERFRAASFRDNIAAFLAERLDFKI